MFLDHGPVATGNALCHAQLVEAADAGFTRSGLQPHDTHIEDRQANAHPVAAQRKCHYWQPGRKRAALGCFNFGWQNGSVVLVSFF